MEIMIDLEEVVACIECGIIVDKRRLKIKQKEYIPNTGICPVCKAEINIEED